MNEVSHIKSRMEWNACVLLFFSCFWRATEYWVLGHSFRCPWSVFFVLLFCFVSLHAIYVMSCHVMAILRRTRVLPVLLLVVVAYAMYSTGR